MFLDLDQKNDFLICGYKRFAKNEMHITRQSREDVLILMLDGTLYFTENGAEVSVSRGEYYIQPRGNLQSALRPSDDAYYAYFHFNGSWRRGGVNTLPQRGVFDIEKIYRHADLLCRNSRKGMPLVSITRAFCEILECLLEDNKSRGESVELAEKIHGYLSENYADGIDVTEVARKFSYSPDYVIRVFKRAYGITPHSYITARRIEYAKLLLSTTNRPVCEISEACGYTDHTAFYRAFCATVGISPAKWRGGAQ